MKKTGDRTMSLDPDAGTVFEIDQAGETGKFYIKVVGENRWLQYSGSGGGFRLYSDNNNATNSKISITMVIDDSVEYDPYGLDGKTYGIAYHTEDVKAAALTAETTLNRIVSDKMIVRRDILDNSGNLLVAPDKDIVEWTFKCVEGNRYYITTMVNGNIKYLTIDGITASLTDEPDTVHSVITVTAGSGDHNGKYRFSCGGYSLHLAEGKTDKGFGGIVGINDYSWMHLLKKTEALSDDDFTLYTAHKVSISDTEKVYNKEKVIVYTRIWNESELRYDFYVLDRDGSLIPVYESGDMIQWVSGRYNTALWEFTEYTDTDGNPNYYYELQNDFSGEYLAPQTGEVLFDHTVGINLGGRRFGNDYSTVIAWDDMAYAYVGLKNEDGHVIACPMSDADSYYFAIMDETSEQDELTEVATVSNGLYGIKMKMQNYPYQGYFIHYSDSNRNVKYEPTYTNAAGKTYSSVFLLKPGETAEIEFPPDTTEYKIIECGVDTAVYGHVYVDGTEIFGHPYGNTQFPVSGNENDSETLCYSGSSRSDFGIPYTAVDSRPKVEYNNEVNENALRTLSVTKILHDIDGTVLSRDNSVPANRDDTVFSLRLHLGGEDSTDLLPAYMADYCVRDEGGNYCRWNSDSGRFESLGVSDYSALSDGQKASATFTTSMNGSISRIPAGFTVELRDVLVGTRFMAEERTWEIPDGYSLDKYLLKTTPGGTQSEAQSGSVLPDTDPNVEVHNLKGWGFRVYKEWSDADYMSSHDPICFALYAGDGLIADSVRQMTDATEGQSLYWYYERLMPGTSFEDYTIREVTVSGGNIQVDSNGIVTGYDSVTPVTVNGTLVLYAVPNGHDPQQFTYTVNYEDITGTPANVKETTVTNSRPGIKLVKTDWNWDPIEGGVFEIKDTNGTQNDASDDIHMGQGIYTSDETGLATVIYLDWSGVFTIKETQSPTGYQGITETITVTKDEHGEVTVTCGDSDSYIYSNSGEIPTVKVRNKPYDFKAVKVDGADNSPLPGVHFSLHRQAVRINGELGKFYLPVEGYEDLVTGSDGVIPGINRDLPAGTYYLCEIDPPAGYDRISEDVCFTVSAGGIVTIAEGTDRNLAVASDPDTGEVTYTLSIVNARTIRTIRFKKVDVANTDRALEGAVFDLYRVVDGVQDQTPSLSGLTSDSSGIIHDENNRTEFVLGGGTYHLIETTCPPGYRPMADAVVLNISAADIYYDDGSAYSRSGSGISYSNGVYTLSITNSSGLELPMTGGRGTMMYKVTGLLLMAAPALLLPYRRRRRRNRA